MLPADSAMAGKAVEGVRDRRCSLPEVATYFLSTYFALIKVEMVL